MQAFEPQWPRPKRINFILTNRCNLRCTYCPEGSHPDSYYADLDDTSFEEITKFVRDNGVVEAGLAYYGELTLVRDWWKKARRLLDMGVALTATTNGHLPLSDEEVATFARFKYVEFSIDSHDEETVRKVRKKVSVRTIIHNFHRIRAYCYRNVLTLPDLVWTGVMSHHVVNQLPDFVCFAHSNGVSRLNFNEIVIYEGAVEKRLNVVDLPEAEFREAVASIETALKIASRLGVKLAIGELPRIRARQEGRDIGAPLVVRSTPVAPTLNHTEGDSIPEGYTRDCGAPWHELYLDPKGQVFACCNRGEEMGTARTSAELQAVFGNEKYQALRNGLKTGRDIDPACATCAVRPIVPVQEPQKNRIKSALMATLGKHPKALATLAVIRSLVRT